MTVPETDVTRAAARSDAGEVLLLDVREDDEWAAGHAPRAVHAPMSRLSLEDVPLGRQVVAVCRSGNRSGQATLALVAAGRDVVNMTGGMRDWAAAGLPVVREDGASGTVL